ncbi:NUDIX hydrolase [Corynebacterium lizhenjunii]|uniref:NUDIX hydrolase n=1 Tax=Corynebacterium lizhenjunii TaxID=2709394 RepID=A0A7T0KGD1_9CORY|nr:NUDIX hydrolase [Corynebacterium lizhenjunii]QPK80084.1 NUDIX hydrolase [Corynebacterium lizhenjunii]
MAAHNKLGEGDKDTAGETFVTGRYQAIGADPAGEYPRTTLAAGAVVWRGERDNPTVAIIHRPHYDDWSLPKGKVDPGESLPVTAQREIQEETGFDITLGKLLGKVAYPVQGRTKVVYYWAARWEGGEFVPNEEVDEVRWVTFAEAARLLTYAVDAQVLDKARKRIKRAPTTRVLLVRHAHAHQRHNWHGDDDLRPLDKKGRRQAKLLATQLAAFGPTAVYAAPPQRCRQTAAPVSDLLGLPVQDFPELADSAFSSTPQTSLQVFNDIVAGGGTPVVVSQGETIRGVLEAINPGFLQREEADFKAKKGSVWVLSFQDGVLTGADYLASPLPVR